jgi:signal transduction histidine kinase/CheY-like chemotaxis protein/HPt (histidine-containing phosphotransfer) domain-containing protein
MLAFGVTTGVPLAFLVVPLSVWVAFRYHTTLAALHGLFTGTTMIALTLAARGPFALQAPQVRVMLAQAFIGMVSMLTLWLALRRDERVELERELEHARDEALEASTLKSAFLANMSHEIRTPMNGVLGMTELLLDTGLDHRQRDYATQVRGSAESLLKIIDDILDVSKIEAGKLTFEHAPFSLRDALEDVRALLAPQAEAKGIALTLHVADGVPALLGGDPVRVRQIVTNLLGNAVKFTDRGGIDVRVGGDREQVTIVIVDTGVGIAPDVLPDLFDAFAQADATTTRRFGGTGLGLAIARQLAELMGGGIHAVSTPGSGSTFTVTLRLPAVEGEAPPRRETKQPPPSAAGSLPVLVVEDNPVNQIVASEMLRKRGVPVQLAVNGREAVDMVRAHRFAAVFMDCQMPELDGYEATRELRRLGETLPIIAMTANAMKGDREKCLDAGMDDYLAKPLRADELDASLARWLGAAVVDPSFLAELGSLAGGIIDVFVSDADQRVADFVAALAEGDVEAARKPVHSLAGSAASVGAVHLAEVARRAQYADDPGALLDELGEALAVTRAAFTR